MMHYHTRKIREILHGQPLHRKAEGLGEWNNSFRPDSLFEGRSIFVCLTCLREEGFQFL
jgi:hypothetical protein